MGKPTICLGENKSADQLRSNCEADQRLWFCYSDSTVPLLLKSEISSSYCKGRFVSDLVGNDIVVFPTRRLVLFPQVRDPLNGPIDENERLERREVIWETKFGSYQQYREAVKRFSLSPGHYIILPCTYKPHKEANFLLRIFTEQPALSGYVYAFPQTSRSWGLCSREED